MEAVSWIISFDAGADDDIIKESMIMYIIVGLGNPGKKYDSTRHNIGFEVVDYIGRKFDIPVTKPKFKAHIGEGRIGSEKVILVKPQTYMNLSGESVMSIVEYYDVPMENVIVIYDDIDTEMGKIRIRKKGSAGSHNGMKSIIYLLQDDSFPRIRMGIGKPDNRQLADFVLDRFTKDEIPYMEDAIKNACDSVEIILKEDIDKAMNNFNKK